jgi:hypothetical protein
MNTRQFNQSVKRFIAAFALSAFLLVGAAGPQPASIQSEEMVAYVQPSKITIGDIMPGGGVLPQGNFWSG